MKMSLLLSPEVVLFPTPPLPEAITTTLSTPDIGARFGSPRAIKSACRWDTFVQ